MLILLTGEPGVGKSTVLLRLVNILRGEGISVGGVIAKEVRDEASGRRRVGFEFVDVISGSRARLASIGIDGPRMGRYAVDLDGCRDAATMLLRAMAMDCRVVVFDEIGPMELRSAHLIDALGQLLGMVDRRDVVVVIHKRLKHWMISRYRERASMLVEVKMENRDSLPTTLADTIKDKWGRIR